MARTHGYTAFIDHIKRYLTNEPQSKDTYPLTRFKLTPTPSDQDLFHDMIDLTAADAEGQIGS